MDQALMRLRRLVTKRLKRIMLSEELLSRERKSRKIYHTTYYRMIIYILNNKLTATYLRKALPERKQGLKPNAI